jgi:hypothetical protein
MRSKLAFNSKNLQKTRRESTKQIHKHFNFNSHDKQIEGNKSNSWFKVVPTLILPTSQFIEFSSVLNCKIGIVDSLISDLIFASYDLPLYAKEHK